MLAAWCGWVSGFHRSSSAAEITWVVSLAIVVALGVAFWLGRRGARFGWHLEPAADPWPRLGRGGSRLALRGVAPWLVVIALAAAWDVLGIDTGPHEYHLTISALSQAFRPLNAVLLFVWMFVGIGYAAARARAPLEGRLGAHAGGPAIDAAQPQHGGAWGAGLASASARGHSLVPALLLPSNRPVGVVFWIGLLWWSWRWTWPPGGQPAGWRRRMISLASSRRPRWRTWCSSWRGRSPATTSLRDELGDLLEPALLSELAEAVRAYAEPDVGHVGEVLAGDEPHEVADLALAVVAGEAGERLR